VDVGPAELLIVLLVVLVLFGGAKIPELARSLGRASKEFKEGLRHDPESSDSEPPARQGP
jgi:sec-independent protein translocase protein TatA